MTELQPGGDGFSNVTKGHPGCLLESDDGLESIGLQGGVDAQKLAPLVFNSSSSAKTCGPLDREK